MVELIVIVMHKYYHVKKNTEIPKENINPFVEEIPFIAAMVTGSFIENGINTFLGKKGKYIKKGKFKVKRNSSKVKDIKLNYKKYNNKNSVNSDRIEKKSGARNINFVDKISLIKEHLFQDGDIRRFDPDFWQASTWERMVIGYIGKYDELFLNHEFYELNYMKKFNCPYEEAHKAANKLYNWEKSFFK